MTDEQIEAICRANHAEEMRINEAACNRSSCAKDYDQRDFLSEAWRIIEGDSVLIAQNEHLVALDAYWRAAYERLQMEHGETK